MKPEILTQIVVIGLLFLSVITALVITILKYRRIRIRYAKIIDVDSEVETAKSELLRITKELNKTIEESAKKKEDLSRDYNSAKAIFDKLQSEVALLEENLEDISFGLYKPHYEYDTSEDYRKELDKIYEQQKALTKSERAAMCRTQWSINNSKREGARMQKQYMKLLLRAFNGECDAAVVKVSWNNVTRMEERIQKAFEAINKLGEVMQIYITNDYLSLKLAELRLSYEAEQKKHDEIEEQRAIREQMREEERALKEAEKAKQEAEQEENRYQKALDKARSEIAKAKGEELTSLNEKIALLEKQLSEAHQLKERAQSLAEITRSGHVYVISNIGSFGETVLKIGMTRRLEPLDRVKELGDASVPFAFDVHAMIYSKDAPSLENEFHKRFADRRLNLVNFRKEFFSISIQEIEEFAKSKGLEIHLTKIAEAREYRETLSMKAKQQIGQQSIESDRNQFPAHI